MALVLLLHEEPAGFRHTMHSSLLQKQRVFGAVAVGVAVIVVVGVGVATGFVDHEVLAGAARAQGESTG